MNAKLQKDLAKVKSIVSAMMRYDIQNQPAWEPLAELSSKTEFDGMEIEEDAVVLRGNEFQGQLAVYVILNYGDKKDHFEMSDSFLGEFRGHFDNDLARIESVNIDTSPFYDNG